MEKSFEKNIFEELIFEIFKSQKIWETLYLLLNSTCNKKFQNVFWKYFVKGCTVVHFMYRKKNRKIYS